MRRIGSATHHRTQRAGVDGRAVCPVIGVFALCRPCRHLVREQLLEAEARVDRKAHVRGLQRPRSACRPRAGGQRGGRHRQPDPRRRASGIVTTVVGRSTCRPSAAATWRPVSPSSQATNRRGAGGAPAQRCGGAVRTASGATSGAVVVYLADQQPDTVTSSASSTGSICTASSAGTSTGRRARLRAIAAVSSTWAKPRAAAARQVGRPVWGEPPQECRRRACRRRRRLVEPRFDRRFEIAPGDDCARLAASLHGHRPRHVGFLVRLERDVLVVQPGRDDVGFDRGAQAVGRRIGEVGRAINPQ